MDRYFFICYKVTNTHWGDEYIMVVTRSFNRYKL